MRSSPFIQFLNFLEDALIDQVPVPSPLYHGGRFAPLGDALEERHLTLPQCEQGAGGEDGGAGRGHDTHQGVARPQGGRGLSGANLALVLGVILHSHIRDLQVPLALALVAHNLISFIL